MKNVLLTAALALVLAPIAQAAGPVQSTSPWDRTRVIAAGAEACPFAIQVHSSGTIHTWTFLDGTVKTILQDSTSSGRTSKRERWPQRPSADRPSSTRTGPS